MSQIETFCLRLILTVWIVVFVCLLTIGLASAVTGIAANDHGYNLSSFSFEDGSHVLQVGKYQVNWCEAGAACDSSDMEPLLELRIFDDPYQG